ncbi:MAG: amino acid adenylation domain-containing protein, partial [bacterium]|nr:amino acid adenylation domain-containing protein [bacterium]
TLEAYDHQEVPFEKVVEATVKNRDMSQNPLFEVMFILQNTPEIPNLNLGELLLSQKEYTHATALLDITISLSQTEMGLYGTIEFKTDLFGKETIQRMLKHFKLLLKSILKSPNRAINEMEIVSESERNHLLNEFNDFKIDFPKDATIINLFEEQTAKSPLAIAAVFGKKKITYKELNERANQLANYLRDKGVETETLVAIYIERSIEMIVGILGILKSGGAYVPIDPEFPQERINFMLKDSGAKIILTSSQSRKKLSKIEQLTQIELDKDLEEISNFSNKNIYTKLTSQNLAYLIYTSGSTGIPKGVLVEHGNVVNLLKSMKLALSFSSDSSFLSVTTYSFDIAYLEFYLPLITGGRLIMVPKEVTIDGQKLAQSISHYLPTHVQGTPSTWLLLLESQWQNNEGIKILIGGEALVYSLKEELIKRGEVFNLYGPTETTIWSTFKKLNSFEKVLIGKPISNNLLYILDFKGELCPIGVHGEIHIGGEQVARGYLNREELTQERFIRDPFSSDRNARMFKTGDLGRWLPDGNIEYLSRIDEQVKINGFRIELGEVESSIQKTNLVGQSVVVVKNGINGIGRMLGYFTPSLTKIKEREQELYLSHVANWKDIYEAEYATSEVINDEEFDIDIWKDSFLGEPISIERMKEWVQDITRDILADKPNNILEIGCGTGLIYYQLAGKVNKYIGTDFSNTSISRIKQRISKKLRDYGQTKLIACAAHEVFLEADEDIDTIVLNSIVQYFPSEQYFDEVLSNCISLIAGKGRIIVGDVRDLRLLKLFKAHLDLNKVQQTINLSEYQWMVDQNVFKEKELCIHPEYFLKLKTIYPEISHIEIKWKDVSYTNELSAYRYTVIMYLRYETEILNPEWQQWKDSNTKNNFENILKEGCSLLAIKNVPNPRLLIEKAIAENLVSNSSLTMDDLIVCTKIEERKTAAIDELILFAQSCKYSYRLLLAADPLKVNIVFEKVSKNIFISNPYNEATHLGQIAYTNI